MLTQKQRLIISDSDNDRPTNKNIVAAIVSVKRHVNKHNGREFSLFIFTLEVDEEEF